MIPINIAVTGHRDLRESDLPAYKNAIGNVIDQIQATYPDSPVNVLTGMAEGADMLGAEAALEKGCSIVAVIPFDVNEYVRTFRDVGSVQKFHILLNKASCVIDVSKRCPDAAGDARYAALGEFLIRNAQALIAVWDGMYNGKRGGTGNVVRAALEGVQHEKQQKRLILDEHDKLPVYHIQAHHFLTGEPVEQLNFLAQDTPFGYRVLYPADFETTTDAGTYYHMCLVRIDEYNHDAQAVTEEETAKSAKYLLSYKDTSRYLQLERLIHEYTVSDVLAMKHQKQTISLLKLLLLCGFMVFFWVTLFDEILPQFANLLLLVPLFFGLCFVIYRRTQSRRTEMKYYEYRALCESLRVQIFWKLAGVEDDVFECYPRKSESDLRWIVSALSNITLEVQTVQPENDASERHALVYQRWIDDQSRFFQNRYRKTKKILKRRRRTATVLFGLSMLFVALMYISQMFVEMPVLVFSHEWSISSRNICLFLIDILLAIGAIVAGYIEKRQFESQNAQYLRMIQIYRQGVKAFESAMARGDEETMKYLFEEIGIEAICENADWVRYNFENTMDMPIGR